MRKYLSTNKQVFQFGILLAILLSIILSLQVNFLLFHTLAEVFSILIAASTFIFMISTFRYHNNSFVYVLGITLFFVSFFDTLHTFSYKGINLFQGYGTDLPTQLWIAGRFLQSVGFLYAIISIGKEINTKILFPLSAVISALVLLSIFTRIFPVCYIDGQGLTVFKKIAEYVICCIQLFSIWLLIKRKHWLDDRIYLSMLLMSIFTILSELSFTFYISVYGLSNIIGHVFKVLAYIFLFEGILKIGLDDPFSLMYEQLQEAQEGLRLTQKIFDVALNGILVFDLNWQVNQVNQAASVITGYSSDEMLGMQINSFFSDADFSDNFERIQLSLNQQGSWMGEMKGLRKDGASLSHMVIFQAIQDETGALVQYFCIMIDITKRMQVESLLEYERSKLAQEVEEKTAELRLKNQELTTALETQEHFFATMSHELRTPLNAVIGYSDLLLQKTHSEEQQDRYSTVINQSGHHLLALINDMLDISRMGAGKLTLYVEPVSMTDIFSQTLAIIQHQADPKKIRIIPQVSCDHQIFLLDGRRVMQILVNLLNNAVKFSPEGSVIEFTASYQQRDQQFQFQISDQGIGIDEEDQKRIFDPFYQVESNLTRSFEGTGLGLTVVKNLVAIMEGSIYVESGLGKGTTFIVTIPCEEKSSQTKS